MPNFSFIKKWREIRHFLIKVDLFKMLLCRKMAIENKKLLLDNKSP